NSPEAARCRVLAGWRRRRSQGRRVRLARPLMLRLGTIPSGAARRSLRVLGDAHHESWAHKTGICAAARQAEGDTQLREIKLPSWRGGAVGRSTVAAACADGYGYRHVGGANSGRVVDPKRCRRLRPRRARSGTARKFARARTRATADRRAKRITQTTVGARTTARALSNARLGSAKLAGERQRPEVAAVVVVLGSVQQAPASGVVERRNYRKRCRPRALVLSWLPRRGGSALAGAAAATGSLGTGRQAHLRARGYHEILGIVS